MDPTPETDPRTSTRRAIPGGAARAMAALHSGCAQRARSPINRQSDEQASLTFKNVPADEGRAPTEMARSLATNADEVFEGRLHPAAVPISGEGWTAPVLRWDGEDSVVPFVGANGELDVTEARAHSPDAGYQYDEDDQLISR